MTKSRRQSIPSRKGRGSNQLTALFTIAQSTRLQAGQVAEQRRIHKSERHNIASRKGRQTHQPTPKAAPLRTGTLAAAAPVAAGSAAGAAATAGNGLAAGRDCADTGPASNYVPRQGAARKMIPIPERA